MCANGHEEPPRKPSVLAPDYARTAVQWREQMGNVSRRMYRWTFGVLLTGALAATATPAAAKDPITKFSRGPDWDFHYGCFGYTGSFRGGTCIALVDWQGDGSNDECF